jgi:hypothetical protein
LQVFLLIFFQQFHPSKLRGCLSTRLRLCFI